MAESIEKRIAKIVEAGAFKGRVISAVTVKGSEIRVEFLPPEDKQEISNIDLVNFRR